MKTKQTAFRGFDKSFQYDITDDSDVLNNPDWEAEFNETLKHELSLHECMKFQSTWRVSLKKKDDVESKPYFNTKMETVVDVNEIPKIFSSMKQSLKARLDSYQKEGSGWVFNQTLGLYLNVHKYDPLKASSYIDLPPIIKNKQACINPKNKDQKCFMWSILAQIHPTIVHPERISNYKNYENELNFNGIPFPVEIKNIGKFEKQNPDISINCFVSESETSLSIYPKYVTKEKGRKHHVNLLHISKDQNSHYVLIKDFNKLMYTITKHKEKKHFCYYCLNHFSSQQILDKHIPDCCAINDIQKVTLPEEGKHLLTFRNFDKQLAAPIVIYADFECILPTYDSVPRDETTTSFTDAYQSHIPCGFAYKVVSVNPDYTKETVVYRGENAADKFLDALQDEYNTITKIKAEVKPMTDLDEDKFRSAKMCHICRKPLEKDKVRYHCHITGKYRGPAHNNCNLNYKYKSKVPVIFHNLRGYDSHLIMQAIGRTNTEDISCIPYNMEKYLSFTYKNLLFLDSMQFMNSSLEKLAKNLTDYPYVKQEFGDKCGLITRKGVYPYDYLDSFDKFDEPRLPPQGAFYSFLKEEHISDADYTHTKDVWQTFNMKTMGDYHDLYLKTDVLLLADVFENFRAMCLKHYSLDPAHYFSAPGLAWDAALKQSNVTLELLTDPDMHLMIEKGIRGGISVITNRYSVANNPYLPSSYNPEEPKTYIEYLDANNLYGWAMSQPLPVGDFKWVEKMKEGKGYILEVDLEYPEELHSLHSDYPLAPEKMIVTEDMLSPYCRRLKESGPSNIEKLIPNLNNKSKYVLHYKNLEFYQNLGLKVTKIHRIIEFTEKPWLKDYIDFNTNQRKKAANDFEKDFFKLMNNSVFGKTMENVRKHKNVKLVNDVEKRNKLIRKPNFSSMKIF